MGLKYFLSIATYKENGCIELKRGARCNHKYPVIVINGKAKNISRVILEEKLGHVLIDNALHTCNNVRCINPEHLYEGTQSDNMKDCVASHRHNMSRKTHCPKGHEYTPENTYFFRKGNRRICRACRRK